MSTKITTTLVVVIFIKALGPTFRLPSVLGTVNKFHPQTGGIDFTRELFQERNHHKSIKIHFLILIAVVGLRANGRLLLTTGDILLISCIIVKIFAYNFHFGQVAFAIGQEKKFNVKA